MMSWDESKMSDLKRRFWGFCYFGLAYGWRERPFVWAVAPHPLWANKVAGYLYSKWTTAYEQEQKG